MGGGGGWRRWSCVSCAFGRGGCRVCSVSVSWLVVARSWCAGRFGWCLVGCWCAFPGVGAVFGCWPRWSSLVWWRARSVVVGRCVAVSVLVRRRRWRGRCCRRVVGVGGWLFVRCSVSVVVVGALGCAGCGGVVGCVASGAGVVPSVVGVVGAGCVAGGVVVGVAGRAFGCGRWRSRLCCWAAGGVVGAVGVPLVSRAGWLPAARSFLFSGRCVVGVVGFAGPRRGVACSVLVALLVRSVLSSGRSVAAGCASGVDACAVRAAVLAGAASRLSVFAVFGAGGVGSVGRSSSVSGVSAAAAAGARVVWWAGGGPGVPVVPRLSARSLALVRAVAAGGSGSGLVVVVSGPPPRPFRGRRGWFSCGSGSWGSAASAAFLGVPVVLFPVGFSGPLPALPGGGRWVPAAGSLVWRRGFRWVPAFP